MEILNFKDNTVTTKLENGDVSLGAGNPLNSVVLEGTVKTSGIQIDNNVITSSTSHAIASCCCFFFRSCI